MHAKRRRKNRLRANRPSAPPNTDEPAQQRRPDQPPWLPTGPELRSVPPEVRQTIETLVEPFYRERVLNARNHIDRSVGFSMAHILWMEIVGQLQMREECPDVEAVLGFAPERRACVADQLRLIDTKIRAANFLARAREIRHRHSKSSAPPSPKQPTTLDPGK